MLKQIYVSGSVAYDEIMNFPHHFKDYFHPEKLHQINVSFAVSDLAKHLGGITTNIVYALRNTVDYYTVISTEVEKSQKKRSLDSKKDLKVARDDKIMIFPIAAVGRDGDEILEFFKANNIDTSYVQKDAKLYTATGKVITDMNDNQIWGFYYGAARLLPKLETPLRSASSEGQANSDFWIISATHEKPFSAALRHVISKKLPYMLDPGMTLTWIRDDLLKKGVLNATYVIGNDYEIAMIEKRLKMTVRQMAAKGIQVITTLGEKGVILTTKDETIKVKAFRVRKVVDPTGAGDAWRGGFVGALAAGKTMKECLVMGNVMASFTVGNVGTVEYETTKEEITKRVNVLS